MGIVRNLLGGSNEAKIKKLRKTVDAVEVLEPDFAALSDNELQTKTEANADNDNGDADTVDRLVEIIEWNGDLIREARVFQA